MKKILKGMGVTYSGTFGQRSRSEVETALRDMGATITASVNTKTHLFVVGHRASPQKVDKARLSGISILDIEQLELLLKGTALAEVLALHEEEAPPPEDLDDVLSRVRHIVAGGATPETWKALCDLLDHTAEDDLDILLDYIIPHTAEWPWKKELSGYWGIGAALDMRRPLNDWTEQLLTGNDSKKFRVVRSVQLNQRKLVGKVAKRLLETDHLDQMLSLDIGRNNISGVFFKELAKRGIWGQLQWLDYSQNKLNASAISSLVDATQLTELSHLMLRDTALDDAGLERFLQASHMSALTHLDLARNQDITDAGFVKLAQTPHLAGLKVLDLQSTNFGNAALQAIAESPYLTQLEELHIHNTQVRTEGLAALAESPNTAHLAKLNISSNYLDNDAFEAFARGQFPQLRSLDAGYNKAGADGIKALANAPFASNLEELIVWSNTCGNKGASALAKATHMTQLKNLSVGGCDISVKGICALLEAKHLGQLEHLNVDRFGEPDDIKEISKVLAKATHFPKEFRTKWKEYWLRPD